MKGFGQLKKLLGFGKNSVKEAKKEDKHQGLNRRSKMQGKRAG